MLLRVQNCVTYLTTTTTNHTDHYAAIHCKPLTCFGAGQCKYLLASPTQEQRESDVVTARITQTETLSPLQTISGSQSTRVMSQRDVIDFNKHQSACYRCG